MPLKKHIMTKLEIKDLNGAPIKINQYGNNLVWINTTNCDVLIDKETALSIVKTLNENFGLNNLNTK